MSPLDLTPPPAPMTSHYFSEAKLMSQITKHSLQHLFIQKDTLKPPPWKPLYTHTHTHTFCEKFILHLPQQSSIFLCSSRRNPKSQQTKAQLDNLSWISFPIQHVQEANYTLLCCITEKRSNTTFSVFSQSCYSCLSSSFCNICTRQS